MTSGGILFVFEVGFFTGLEPRDPPVTISLLMGLQVCTLTPSFLYEFWGIELRFSCLQGACVPRGTHLFLAI